MAEYNLGGVQPSRLTPCQKARDAGNKLVLTAFLLFVIQLSLSLLYGTVTGIAAVAFPGAVHLLETQIFMQFVLYLPSFLLAVFLCRFFLESHNLRFHPGVEKTGFSQMFPREDVPLPVFVGCVLLSLGAAMLGNCLSLLMDFLFSALGLPQPQVILAMPESLGGIAFYFLTVAVLPAFLEEILWRGAIYAFFKDFGPFSMAWISGFLFMVFHQNFSQFPSAFCFGFATGYLIGKFKNIWIGVVAHFCNNFLACLLQLIEDRPYYEAASAVYVAVSLLVGILVLILFLVLGVLKSQPNDSGCPHPVAAVLTRPAVILYTVLCLGMAVFTLYFRGA